MRRNAQKFQVSIFSRSSDIEEIPKFKTRSRDLGQAPFDPNFACFE